MEDEVLVCPICGKRFLALYYADFLYHLYHEHMSILGDNQGVDNG